jgi:lantibiotic biosynthesis protein
VTDGSFFVLRAPLLPFETIVRLGDGLRAPAALDDHTQLSEALMHDRSCLRAQMRDLVQTPAIREAIFVASPDLDAAVDQWLVDPDSPRVRGVERSLVRYLTRMSARPTPFGLFASTCLGVIGDTTRLIVAPIADCRRHTRLDTDYLTLLADALARDATFSVGLRYQPNSSLHRAADRWRYVETRLENKARAHHLVAVDDSAALQETIARASEGVDRAALASALVDEDVTAEEADAYIGELIESQILVSELACPVTGTEPLEHLTTVVARLPAGAETADRLATIGADLDAIDRGDVRIDPARYRAIAHALSAFPATGDPARLFQVDLVRRGPSVTLGRDVLDEIRHGASLLHRLAPRDDGELARFRAAFVERYEQREVPLLEALDEESGIGAALGEGSSRDASPLLRGFELPAAPFQTIPWGAREAGLLRRVGDALAAGRDAIDLSAADVDALAVPDPPPLAAAFAVMATVAAADEAACARGEFRVVLHSVSGPSGAALLGRFCHADPVLASHVRQHLRDEEALDPDAVFAEIVHLPQGRLGNILLRPTLREFEIPYLGHSGAPADRQIAVSDLTLSVSGDRFVLRSRRLGRRIVPRLTTAHNFRFGSLGVYRLLCLLQADGHMAGCGWSWGVLSALPYLPRVTCGRLVLSRATWNVTATEIRSLIGAKDAERYARVQTWRHTRRLPRWVVVADGDNTLPIDLDNVLAVESFVQLLNGRSQLALCELYPGPDELLARGVDGRFVHEIIVPFTTASARGAGVTRRTAATESRRCEVRAPAVITRQGTRVAQRVFPPGSLWTYAKIYAGPSAADLLLHEVLGPLSRALIASGDIDLWFFVRYADPDPHVRWRLHASTPHRARAARRAVEDAIAPLIDAGRVRRLAFDTYEREVERYGGAYGIDVAEQVFCADTEAALDILAATRAESDAGIDVRWRLALSGADRLLCDLGLGVDARRAVARRLRDSFGKECRVDTGTRGQLAARYRGVQRELLAQLESGNSATPAMADGLAALARRSARLRGPARELACLEQDQRLTVPVAELAESYVHMHINRLLRAEHRLHELFLYDFLARLHEQAAARLSLASME